MGHLLAILLAVIALWRGALTWRRYWRGIWWQGYWKGYRDLPIEEPSRQWAATVDYELVAVKRSWVPEWLWRRFCPFRATEQPWRWLLTSKAA